MSYVTTILYKVEDDTDFDLEYYLNEHMPLCARVWNKYGMTGWSVTKFDVDPRGGKPVYAVRCDSYWESEEGARKAFNGPESGEVMEDIAKYSKTQPIVLFGKPLAEATI
ncbi:hypothetical protein BJX68DRAFT_269416 [Aspergillus pseudodeflectus]|uniref:EthD domain-containing protein n=1 Tax=Aspergillus pseudodeflectus TaxID=176178 RepID=A0ABR4JXV0_9EURO